MAEIEEIPIDTHEILPDNQEILNDIQEEIPEPKKKGRPQGARNKPKPATPLQADTAPKQKAKIKAKKKPVVEDEYESEEKEAPRRKAYQQTDRHALAAEVLSLLQQQRYDRTHARRNHYASWFTNM